VRASIRFIALQAPATMNQVTGSAKGS